MKAIGIAAVLMLASASAGRAEPQGTPQQWLLMEIREERITAFEVSGIRTMGNVRRGWYIIVNRERDDQGSDYSLNSFDLDCVEETFRLRSIALYSLDGSSVETFRPDSPAEPVIPGSGGHLLYQNVCVGLDLGETISATSGDFARQTRVYLSEPR